MKLIVSCSYMFPKGLYSGAVASWSVYWSHWQPLLAGFVKQYCIKPKTGSYKTMWLTASRKTKHRTGDRAAQQVELISHSKEMCTGIPPLTSPVWAPSHPRTGKLLGESVPMPLHRNTCSTNSRVYIAAAVIGHDKTSCTFITDSPCSIYGTPLPFLHTPTHTDLHYNRNKTFPDQQFPV